LKKKDIKERRREVGLEGGGVRRRKSTRKFPPCDALGDAEMQRCERAPAREREREKFD
jgi:hypothetical protein